LLSFFGESSMEFELKRSVLYQKAVSHCSLEGEENYPIGLQLDCENLHRGHVLEITDLQQPVYTVLLFLT
jgi:hypothetical protein